MPTLRLCAGFALLLPLAGCLTNPGLPALAPGYAAGVQGYPPPYLYAPPHPAALPRTTTCRPAGAFGEITCTTW